MIPVTRPTAFAMPPSTDRIVWLGDMGGAGVRDLAMADEGAATILLMP